MYQDELYEIITDCKRMCRDVALENPKVIFTDYTTELDELEGMIADIEENGEKSRKSKPKVISVGTAKYPKSAYFLNTAETIHSMPWSVQNATIRKAIELITALAKEQSKGDFGWVKVVAPLMIFGAVAICMVWIVIGNGGM